MMCYISDYLVVFQPILDINVLFHSLKPPTYMYFTETH